MKSKMMEAGLFMALAMVVPPLCAANGFKAMAKEFSRAAKNSGIERVAVLPFTPTDGSNPKDGLNISEKLITQIVRMGKLQAVERSLLRNLMEEQHLAQTGMIDQTTLKKIGKVFSVEGIVAGSFVTLGNEVVVNARLVNVETGVIVAAIEQKVDREWFDTAGSGFADGRLASLWVPAPEFTVPPPPIPSEDFLALRDAPAETDCLGAAERVDQLESQILELKARYWAAQLKKGASLANIKVNPGSTITDPILKKTFYDRMKHWYGVEKDLGLTPAEVQHFISVDGKAYSLYRECGV